MLLHKEYDAAIIGGGLAGLACAIQLRRAGHSVVLLEKEHYPFHKVCGEYISLESWDFLKCLGLPLDEMKLPVINTLFLTAPNGKSFSTSLPLGGFGISRFLLDQSLMQIARNIGVDIAEGTKVDRISFEGLFRVGFGADEVVSKVCCAAYGKRSNMDIKWERDFLRSHDKRLDNHVAVKYHIETDWKNNVIGLHNFENGYCGISKIEGSRYCLCYLTKADSLKKNNNSIAALEQQVLFKNPHLKRIFASSVFAKEFPVTISQINFNRKTQLEDHVLMLGDAAGMITPLCGNGMSIALHTGKIAAALADGFLKNHITRQQMEIGYAEEWKAQFSRRLRNGRVLQAFFGSTRMSNLFVSTFRNLPFLARPVVKMTHGKTF